MGALKPNPSVTITTVKSRSWPLSSGSSGDKGVCEHEIPFAGTRVPLFAESSRGHFDTVSKHKIPPSLLRKCHLDLISSQSWSLGLLRASECKALFCL